MNVTDMLIKLARRCTNDPLLFVEKSFDWGHGELHGLVGPLAWQRDILATTRDELAKGGEYGSVLKSALLRIAVASGHGIGKSCLVSWLILWAMCTAADTRGVVTANTDTQLRTKTWAELSKWYRLCFFRSWFTLTATSLLSRQPGHEKSWRIDAVPWSESNPEAFAGLHNKGRRLLMVFDEASAIIDQIWEVAEGAMTDKDTQILWYCFGNPTRSQGRFFDCFNRERSRWITRQIDSRDVEISNKDFISDLLENWGEDSDFFKVRVRGVFPSASDAQFIGRDLVDAAYNRGGSGPRYDLCAMIGVDFARFGDDSTVIATRIGRDATLPLKRFHGLPGNATVERVLDHVIELERMGFRSIHIFGDDGGLGGPILDFLEQRTSWPVHKINFGSEADDKTQFANKRAEMWYRLRDWLKTGAIPHDEALASDLTGPEYGHDNKQRLRLERKEDMKKRGLPSPDAADALALTLALRVDERVYQPQSHSEFADMTFDPFT